MFNQLMTVGLALGAVVCAFFPSLAGFQRMTAGGSRAPWGRPGAGFAIALIGLAIVFLSRSS
jgi:hypothetical protein